MPNLFPEGANDGLYHTADATLWFFHALDRYVARRPATPTLLSELLPDAADDRRAATCAARTSASASIPATACCARAPRATS